MAKVAVKTSVPKEGDIVAIDLNPVKGREQEGYRPALVISPSAYNLASELCLVVPITSKSKGYPFEILLYGNLKTKGVVLCDQVRSISYKVRKIKYLETVDADVLQKIKNIIKTLLR